MKTAVSDVDTKKQLDEFVRLLWNVHTAGYDVLCICAKIQRM
jgi:hypothetical protein